MCSSFQYSTEKFVFDHKSSGDDGVGMYNVVDIEIPQLTGLAKIEYVTDKMALELSELQAAENIHHAIKMALEYEQSRKLDNAFHEAIHVGWLFGQTFIFALYLLFWY